MSNKDDVKLDKGKPRFDLIEPEFTLGIASVLTFGAEKYAPNSWQKIPDPVNRYYAATLRHLNAWRRGEVVDAESGFSPLLHAATNIMFLLHYEYAEEEISE